MTTNFLVVGLAVTAVLGLAVFCARVLGYLEWGGWAAKWSGRGETQLLHAAAQHARLRIGAAKSMPDVLGAFALVAPETFLRELHADLPHGCEAVKLAEADAATVEVRLQIAAHDATLTLVLDGSKPLDAEHRVILEELGHAATQRLAELRMAFVEDTPDANPPAHAP